MDKSSAAWCQMTRKLDTRPRIMLCSVEVVCVFLAGVIVTEGRSRWYFALLGGVECGRVV